MEYLLQCFLMILPILLAGIFFIFIIKQDYFLFLKKPIDLGLKFRGKRIFGANKTLRGFFIMPIATFLSVVAIGYLMNITSRDLDSFIFNYTLIGSYKSLFYGLAYSVGELPNSFLKRQLGILPGMRAKGRYKMKFFNFFDKSDSLLFCGLVLLIIYKISFVYVAGSFAMGLFLHFLTDLVMIKFKLKA